MRIEIKKFGKILISRPAGREAFAAAKAYILPANNDFNLEPLEIIMDFDGVDVLSPSWADEFITGLRSLFKNAKITFVNKENESVIATLETLAKANY